MKSFKNFAVLAMVCFAVSACGTVQKSSEMKIMEAESSLMVYNGIHQAFNKDGQVIGQATLVGQAKYPAQTVTTQQVPVTVTTQAALPQRPVYKRDCRAAKAVPRTPPQAPPVTKTEMKTVVTTTTTYRGPEVLSSVGGGGPSTGHSVAANIPGAIGQVGSAAVGGYFFKEGMRVLRPNQEQTTVNTSTSVKGVGQGGNAWQQQGQLSNNLNANTLIPTTISGSSSSSTSGAGATAVIGGP